MLTLAMALCDDPWCWHCVGPRWWRYLPSVMTLSDDPQWWHCLPSVMMLFTLGVDPRWWCCAGRGGGWWRLGRGHVWGGGAAADGGAVDRREGTRNERWHREDRPTTHRHLLRLCQGAQPPSRTLPWSLPPLLVPTQGSVCSWRSFWPAGCVLLRCICL